MENDRPTATAVTTADQSPPPVTAEQEKLDLTTLKEMSVTALTKIARDHEIPGATGMRKQELIFEILRARAAKSADGPGVHGRHEDRQRRGGVCRTGHHPGRYRARGQGEEGRRMAAARRVRHGQGEETKSNHIFQLAVNKDGVIRGNYYNAVTDTTEVYGSVDKKTQRAAWTVGDRRPGVRGGDRQPDEGRNDDDRPLTPRSVRRSSRWCGLRIRRKRKANDVSGGPEHRRHSLVKEGDSCGWVSHYCSQPSCRSPASWVTTTPRRKPSRRTSLPYRAPG